MKKDVMFTKGGEITWVSKSGRTEKRRAVAAGVVMPNVTVSGSDTPDHFDIKDGEWTVFGIHKDSFTVLPSKTGTLKKLLKMLDELRGSGRISFLDETTGKGNESERFDALLDEVRLI